MTVLLAIFGITAICITFFYAQQERKLYKQRQAMYNYYEELRKSTIYHNDLVQISENAEKIIVLSTYIEDCKKLKNRFLNEYGLPSSSVNVSRVDSIINLYQFKIDSLKSIERSHEIQGL
jgi:hypothetical protein